MGDSMSRRWLWLLALAFATLVLVLIVGFIALWVLLRPAPKPSPSGPWYVVVRVIDGDTITVRPNPSPHLRRGDDIRLIGVDTPETKWRRDYFGPEATEFVRSQVERKRVRLAFDPGAGRDSSERTLAYVFLEDETFLNEEIVRQGYGCAELRFPVAVREQFLAYEREAQMSSRGLWEGGRCKIRRNRSRMVVRR